MKSLLFNYLNFRIMDAIKLQSRIISKISTALNEFHRTELDPQKLLNLSKQLSKICSVYYSSEQNAVKELQTLEHLKAIIKIMVKKNTLCRRKPCARFYLLLAWNRSGYPPFTFRTSRDRYGDWQSSTCSRFSLPLDWNDHSAIRTDMRSLVLRQNSRLPGSALFFFIIRPNLRNNPEYPINRNFP